MKRWLTLVLALVLACLMSTTTLAAEKEAFFDVPDWELAWNDDLHGWVITLYPGETYHLGVADVATYGSLDLANGKWKLEAKWTKGGALIDTVAVNKKQNTLDLKLKENFTLTDAKELKGKITLTEKGTDTGDEYIITFGDDNAAHTYWATVANRLELVYGEKDPADCIPKEAENNTLYRCDEDSPGYVKFNANALLGCTLNMAGKEKAFMYTDESMIEELAKKFPKADMECYAFGGQPTFKNAARFTLQADYADKYYIYSYTNGKLAKQDAEWDSVEGVYIWETRTPATYIISDSELVAADHTTKNPDTGASNVVGLAAAAACLALLATAGVVWKK